MSSSKIKNIIFDLGGVVINLDVYKTYQRFAELVGIDSAEMEKMVHHNPLFEDYEKGLITSSQFREKLTANFNTTIPDPAFDNAWNAMLLDIPEERWELISDLSQKYTLFVLSNTNDIHIQEFHTIVDRGFGMDQYRKTFKKIYYSFEINRKKPDSEIFEFVLSDQNIAPEETVFFEDTPVNLQAASALNMEIREVPRNQLNLNQIRNEFL